MACDGWPCRYRAAARLVLYCFGLMHGCGVRCLFVGYDRGVWVLNSSGLEDWLLWVVVIWKEWRLCCCVVTSGSTSLQVCLLACGCVRCSLLVGVSGRLVRAVNVLL
jgi:hypothetical protein